MQGSRTDTAFLTAVAAAADERAREVLAGVDGLLAGAPHHRRVMSAAKTLVACAVHPGSALFGSPEAAGAAARLVAFLAGMQGANGLFDGENLASPPDTAFTVNDLCDTYGLLQGESVPEPLRPLAGALEAIAAAAAGPLRLGGVHTPNHRWELSAALARLNAHWPDARLVARVDEWLAEGVDIAPDGMYSERSPNYALFVSNPSLTAIGTLLERPELLDAVCRNLEAVAATALPDGTVETVHSRRQDQLGSIALAPFLMQFRRYAIARGRGDFAAVVARILQEQGLQEPVAYPADALAEILLEPELAGVLPEPEAPQAVSTVFPSSGLAVVRDGAFAVTVFGGTDYAEHGWIRSGLSSNPTFLRMYAGGAVLDSVRLSRDFFGMGPFRAGEFAFEDGEFVLRERVAAAYYQPLPAEHRRAGGDYALMDDGRFSASMDFANRPNDAFALSTEARVRIGDREVRLEVEADPGGVRQVLELSFRDGGELEGVRPSVGGGFEPVDEGFVYRLGDDRIAVHVNGRGRAGLGYHPGEDYTHLSGTDAAQGMRVYVPLPASGRCVVALVSH
ncbi:hypothetical protein [Glycomyces algeriensis]|uniref:Uncharacterized protein n=1 Tax=Glycomyces algeriensis TaxID=256037 RepID=A0A9W6LIJ7_9ACTN|nr:hypothetical protein [Glycomyces algeriensis]MDA1368293.1 hypothetical protein [Glycomyces algeriensis]MDR7351734.1 hypothetical protein [Glycomyces algeriensis]GLI44460.1 hypothetical protein GALLR39Z86_43100 [Glycomyces algeriensis]